MKNYCVDDFNGINVFADTMADAIGKKINLLKDFCLLSKHDDREEIIKAILSKCKSERELDNALHNVVRFNETVDEFIAKVVSEIETKKH